ncbi:MAG TPA: phenylalanine--tRNA ligase subunit beta [Vicinamibacterales bacterium]|nr:phenylalanine--tRNA ligase subunit beta [Vicinamibacterales bacterium]HPW21489.1 phenylalanine--tRNA ligase subunit beta [Vicinamibacterales bacterium]
MRVPLTWLRDYVAITDTPDELASRLTYAGLEVEGIEYVGLAPVTRPVAGLPAAGRSGPAARGLAWDPATIVIARILEVLPHPNADRLTLLRVDDGSGAEPVVLTGAPNVFHLKGAGPLPKPLKIVYAREGAVLIDGHKSGREIITLKRAKIRGVESSSMACSEKELGISDEHDGIIILDDDAPVGAAAAEYMGDVVFEIKINPNMARNACVLGIAREIAALTGAPLKPPALGVTQAGPPIAGRVGIEIREPDLNPRFVLGLIEGVTIAPSPYWVRRRLRLAGTRPINNIVDVTNYVMFELGEPLHAFDFDALVRRADGRRPTIITRRAGPGERITTLDGVERALDPFTILVCDEAGPLSIAGVMGGAETEVADTTANVLLEGAAWNLVNVRRTMKAQDLPSEASSRFARGVHPGLAEKGVVRALELMRQWAGGTVARGLVDSYPGRPGPVVVDITPAEVERQLGLRVPAGEIVRILRALEFSCEVVGDASDPAAVVRATAPDHRLDIGSGHAGKADLVEEIARIHGYERIPETMLADVVPPPHPNRDLEREEQARDVLVSLGLQEIVTYSLTSPEREARLALAARPEGGAEIPYVRLANPIVVDRVVMRRAILPGLIEAAAANSRNTDRMAFFEIGNVFLPRPEEALPGEPRRLALVLSGARTLPGWQQGDRAAMDFFDLKGVIEELGEALAVAGVEFEPGERDGLRPGRSAAVRAGGEAIGWAGELHPTVAGRFGLEGRAVLAAELELDPLLRRAAERFTVRPVPVYPPVKEDLAFVLDRAIPVSRVQEVIRAAGGPMLAGVALFDEYAGEQVGAGKRSLAFSLTYQAPDRTLTDADARKIRERVARALKDELGAALRA